MLFCFFFFKQKTAYELRISDWSSDVCSSDLGALDVLEGYLEYLRNIVDSAAGGHIQPVYGVGGEATLTERAEQALNGYRGMGPVRVGNQAYEQVQQIGRASCRERVCQYVYISVVAEY